MMENISNIVDSFSKLLGTIVWPALILFVIFFFRATFITFFEALSEFSFKMFGFEATFKRKEASKEALVAATVARAESGASPTAKAEEIKAAENAVEALTPRTLRLAKSARVLWVDDSPRNNVHEQEAMEALGIDFVISISTEDALSKLKQSNFDVVISDMGRPLDQQAGYTLLDKMRDSGDTTPLVFYASSRSPEHIAESRRRGALGCTNRPDELFQYVLAAIERSSARRRSA